MNTSPLRVRRRTTFDAPAARPASLRPLPRAPASPSPPTSPEPDARRARTVSLSVRRLPLPPLRSPGDPSDVFGRVAAPPGAAVRDPLWEEEGDTLIDWDLLDEVLCEED
jgi:hypothetical protein